MRYLEERIDLEKSNKKMTPLPRRPALHLILCTPGGLPSYHHFGCFKAFVLLHLIYDCLLSFSGSQLAGITLDSFHYCFLSNLSTACGVRLGKFSVFIGSNVFCLCVAAYILYNLGTYSCLGLLRMHYLSNTRTRVSLLGETRREKRNKK